MDIGDYVIVRGDRSGVFAGHLKQRKESEVLLTEARRIWYWSGAASLSQLAQSGTSSPENCKFPEEVTEILILDAIEILRVSEVAKTSIAEVPIWKE